MSSLLSSWNLSRKSSLLPSWNLSGKQPWHLPHLPSRSSYRKLSVWSRIWLWISVAAFLLLACAYAARSHYKASPSVKIPLKRPEYLEVLSDSNQNEGRYAYVTWFSNTAEPNGTDPKSGYYHADLYFTATRLLVWQLLHDPQTKTTTGVDVVVMVGPHVSQSDRDRLTKDGAIVRPVELVHGQNDSWIVPMESRWADIMGKLRVWQMTEYDKIVVLDTDTVLQSSLDGVFDDPGTDVYRTKPDDAADVTSPRMEDEPELPEEYMLSSYVEIQTNRHSWPPTDPDDYLRPGYFNAGFFMLRPDPMMFDYFVALLDLEGRFDTSCPEQDLINYAFRWNGPMPWRELSHKWNIRCTSPADLAGGVVSVHEKFWKQHSGGQELRELLYSKRWQMEGYYMGLEENQD